MKRPLMLVASIIMFTLSPFSLASTILTQTGTCNIDITGTSDQCQAAATGLVATDTVNLNIATNTFTLTFGLQNTSATSATINAFSLALFDSGFTINLANVPSGWVVVAGGKTTNSGKPNSCKTMGAGLAGDLCVSSTATSGAGAPLVIAAGASTSPYFSFTGQLEAGNTLLNPFDLKVNGEIGGTKYTISGSEVTGPAVTPVPEPSSLLLIASGMVSLTVFLRRSSSFNQKRKGSG